MYRGPPERTLAIYAREFRRIAASRDAPNLVLSAWLVLANPDPNPKPKPKPTPNPNPNPKPNPNPYP